MAPWVTVANMLLEATASEDVVTGGHLARVLRHVARAVWVRIADGRVRVVVLADGALPILRRSSGERADGEGKGVAREEILDLEFWECVRHDSSIILVDG
jgi:flavin-dependent dehydrogenase